MTLFLLTVYDRPLKIQVFEYLNQNFEHMWGPLGSTGNQEDIL